MIETFKLIIGVYDKDVTIWLFNLRIESNTRGQRCKIFKERPIREVRRDSFFFRLTGPWNSLPNQVVEALTVETFERRLDRHWRGHAQLYDFRTKNLSFPLP